MLMLGAITASAAEDGPAEWLERAERFLPEGYVFGQVIATTPDELQATVAVFPEGANDPAAPGSAFDPGHVLIVTLKDTGLRLDPVAGEFREREPIVPSEDPSDHSEAGYAYLHREIWIRGQRVLSVRHRGLRPARLVDRREPGRPQRLSQAVDGLAAPRHAAAALRFSGRVRGRPRRRGSSPSST